MAAEAWARELDDLPDRLEHELDERRRAEKAAEDAEYRARAAAIAAIGAIFAWSTPTPTGARGSWPPWTPTESELCNALHSSGRSSHERRLDA